MAEVSSTGGTAVLGAATQFLALQARGTDDGARLSAALQGPADQATSIFLTREAVNAKAIAGENARGVSIAQIADHGLAQIEDRLRRLEALANEAASGTVGADRRVVINAEFTLVRDEIDSAVAAATFENEVLLDSTETLSFAVGQPEGESIRFALLDATVDGLALTGLDTSSTAGAATALTAVEEAIAQVESARADVAGSLQGFDGRIALSAAQAEQSQNHFAQAEENAAAHAASQAAAAAVLSDSQTALQVQATGNSVLLLDLLG